MLRLRVLRAALVLCVLLPLSSCATDVRAAHNLLISPVAVGGAVPFADADIVNALRGQYRDLDVPLHPQAAQSEAKPWPETYDEGDRFLWSQVQPNNAGEFDFTVIDNAIAKAQKNNARFHFRIMSFASLGYSGDTISGVPGWLRAIPGATTDYSFNGSTYVVPNWNDDAYLAPLEQLIRALGKRYNQDERVAWFEFSGYGDWSENHTGFIATQLGTPGPSPDDSIAQLGYYSQYKIQSITKASITRLVNATLAAFPDTQIITTANNSEITRQFLDATPTRPVGIRADCLGVYPPTQYWGTDPQSWYVVNNDPVIAAMLSRWKTAPIVTEWCNYQPNGPEAYFEQALKDTVNYHVSMVASNVMNPPPALQDMWARTCKYAGYRYAVAVASEQPHAANGADIPITLRWNNYGSAPAYDDWQVQYEVHSNDGRVMTTIPSQLPLRDISAKQDYDDTTKEPASGSHEDSFVVSTAGLPPGEYSVIAKVVWHEHKRNASHVVDYPPMTLAQGGRDQTGGYTVVRFQLS